MRLDHLLSRERESEPFGVAPALTPSQVDRPIFAEYPLGGTRVSVSTETIVATQQTDTENHLLANPKLVSYHSSTVRVQPGPSSDEPGGPGGRLAQLVRALP